MKNNNYIILQSIILILGIIGTTSLSFLYISKYVYLISMLIFGAYNICQMIYFKHKNLKFQLFLFLYFLITGSYGLIQYIRKVILIDI